MPKFKAGSELQTRTDRAKEILEFILGKYEGPTRFEHDIRRVYNVLAHGAKYARMYRTKKA